jgi:hypothetical protein
MNYTINKEKKWDYENGFYLTCGKGRIGKLLNHFEIYKKIMDKPGDILEFGVFKGTSFMRLLYFRDLLENDTSRKIISFDIFGKFPVSEKFTEDKEFIEKFENNGGDGISKEELIELIDEKLITNYELIKGDITQTLPKWLKENPQKRFSMVHLDVDVYEPSIKTIELIYDRIVPGGILMLDDYGTVLGETKAIEEFLKKSNIKPDFKKVNYYHIPTYIIKE